MINDPKDLVMCLLGPIVALCLGLCLSDCHQAYAQTTEQRSVTITHEGEEYEVLVVNCPFMGGWMFKDQLEEFETLCPEGLVEYGETAIKVKKMCPFRAKIKGVEKHRWLLVPCDVALIFHINLKKDEET